MEDKLFGPFTFKQFIYMAGAAGICSVLFTLLPTFLAILFSMPVAALGLALAFYKVNDRPFALTIENLVKFYLGNRLYLWKKDAEKPTNTAVNIAAGDTPQVYLPKLSQSKLKDLTFELDVKNQSNPVTKDTV